jgi:hypothetical protein
MAQFMLLLYDDPNEFAGLEPQEFQKVLGEYQAWGQKMASRGKLVSGHKLKDEGGRHLKTRGKEVLVTDGPFAEAKEVLGGYYIVDAASYDEAVELAKIGPHLQYNGRIEIRQIDPLE